MRKLLLPSNTVEKKAMRNTSNMMKSAARVATVGLVLATTALLPLQKPSAQKKEQAPNVTGISTRKTARGQVISINTDGPVSGTQTWQDPNGKFNLVLPGSGESKVNGGPNGVAVRKLGNSLGIEVPTKPGANVTVQPRANGVDLIVEGEVEADKNQAQANNQTSAQGASTAQPRQPNNSEARYNALPPAANASQNYSAPSTNLGQSNATSISAPPVTAPASAAPASDTNNAAQTAPPASDTNPATQTSAPAAPPAVAPAEEEGGITSYLFSYTGLGVLLGIGLIMLLVLRRRSQGGWENVEEEKTQKPAQAAAPPSPVNLMAEETVRTGERRKRNRRKDSAGGRRMTDQPEALVKSQASAPQAVEGRETTMETRQNVLVPSALFGAYRVDQEVGKLLLGQPHRIDVLASRAPDDRRAMETSLLKALDSPELDEDSRRRVRTALEEYGFVARQSAALLLSSDAYERASAARILGEVQSASSLPFLLEALYDSEQIVRTQAVASIGELKMPSAIGALLDMARRYPDMPANLISRALSNCTIENMDFLGGFSGGNFLLNAGDDGNFTGEITGLEPPTNFEALPEWLEDESLAEALERLASADVEARTAAAQSLAQYQVQRSVDALTVLATQDSEPGVRAAAVTSLGVIDHESVFAPVLLAFVDEAREVRAAAARALSRLNFNRADAYVRLIESSDAESLGQVARALINAGMSKQAIDRLGSEDRRLAYESFTLAALLAKAGENAPLVEAIGTHKDEGVRLAAVKALGIFGQPSVLQQLRELAVVDGIPENVRMALMEVVYKIDQQMHQPEDYAAVPIEPIDC